MRRVFILILMIGWAMKSYGSLPQTKAYDYQKDLINGQVKGVSLTWDGQLILSPDVKQIYNSERLFIWDFVVDGKGNLYIAAGDGAKIYHVDPSGKAKMISQWQNVEVYCLALDQKGMLYAGTSPDGKIYRIAENKAPELFAELKVKYIWDILFDQQNRCYVATGDSGAVYIVDNKGSASILYSSEETHIRCLAWDQNRQLLAGSYPNGYLYRINASGQAFVVYDAEYQEIPKICLAKDGTIYAAGLGQGETKSITPTSREKDRSEIRTDISNLMVISPRTVESTKVTKSGIIKIQPNGVIKDIWQQSSDQVQSIAVVEDQTLLVGTADKGRLYKISNEEESTYLLNLDASQVVDLLVDDAGKVWIATSNLGKIFLLEPEFKQQGSYESEVFDAQTLTHWGSFQWEEQIPSGCRIKFYCRSGNTEKASKTWSPWTELNKENLIICPDARFIQWKLLLATNRKDTTPKIRNIQLSYLQYNLPPEVVSITVHPVERQKEFQSTSMQELPALQISIGAEDDDEGGIQKQPPQPATRRLLQNGYRRVSWKTKDPNDDQLTYDLYFQEIDDKNWWELKKDLTRSSYLWDSRMMPDGKYRIKIVVNDGKSNPINMTKQSEKISDWFIIDNTGPKIQNFQKNRIGNDSLQIAFRIVDELSSIKQVQISYDVKEWLWVYPNDLVCDSKQEQFQFNLPWKKKQIHSIIVKAQDKSENTSYDRISVKE